jgi:hypothetical protein
MFAVEGAPSDTDEALLQDAFVRRARNAVERAIREGGGISPEEMLKRMDDRLAAARLDPRFAKG